MRTVGVLIAFMSGAMIRRRQAGDAGVEESVDALDEVKGEMLGAPCASESGFDGDHYQREALLMSHRPVRKTGDAQCK